jgi:hypothetical protein
MGVNIPNEARFLGVPLVKVRNVLKAWRYGKSVDAADIAKLANVGLDVRTVMMLLDELRDRGLTAVDIFNRFVDDCFSPQLLY